MKKLVVYKRMAYDVIKDLFSPKSVLIRNSIAYSILLSLIPTLALLSIISLSVLKNTLWIQKYLLSIMPFSVVEILLSIGLSSSTYGFIPFIIAIGIAYYTASRGFYAIIVAFSTVDEKHMHRIILTMQSLIAPLAFIILVIMSISLNIFIELLFPLLPYFINVMLTCFIYFILALGFFMLTAYPRRSIKYFVSGSLCFGFGMSLMGIFFMFYVRTFTHYNDIYGSIAFLLLLILALNWISHILYFCHVLNRHYNINKVQLSK